MTSLRLYKPALAIVILLGTAAATPSLAYGPMGSGAVSDGSSGNVAYNPYRSDLSYTSSVDANIRERDSNMPRRLIEQGKKALANGDTAGACKAFKQAQDLLDRQMARPDQTGAKLMAQYCST